MSDVRIITEQLGGSPLSRLMQRGEAPEGWHAATPSSADEWRARAAARRMERDWRSRWDALQPALEPTGEAASRLARVREQGGVVVTTGQQPGLFGGPIYTWSKAASALAFADALEDATGIPTAVVFWAATDDADFAEAASTSVARTGGLEVLRATLPPPAGTPMSSAALGDLGDPLQRLRDACGSASDPRPLDAVRGAYDVPERSHGSAFVALLRTLLAPLGIPVLDASHPAVRSESEPTIRSALARAAEVERALAARASRIRAMDHEPQVDDVPGLALAFVRDAGVKRRLTVAEARTATGHLTPNVLLRPIVEQALLPTVAYMAGPGELAYFAQVGAVAEALEVPVPLALPRWSCTLVEPHVQALLDRLGVDRSDLDQPDALEGRMARAAMHDRSVQALRALRGEIARLPEGLAADSGPLGLDPAVTGAMQSLAHRVDRLERRLVAGIKRRETARMQDVATLRAALRPRGGRQERVLNAIPMLSRNGCGLLLEMSHAARSHAVSLIAPGRPAAGITE
jgi:bacillithiol synthase